MNIIFLLRVWPVYGGGETVTICLANEMVKRGINVFIAYFHDSDPGKKIPFIDNRIKKIKIDGVKLNITSRDIFESRSEGRIVSKKLEAIVKQYNIDIVHNQWWPPRYFDRIREATNVKVISCLHMDVDTRRVFDCQGIKKKILDVLYPIYRRLEIAKNLYRSDRYYKHTDKYIFLAKSFKEYYRKERNLLPDDPKIDYILNPATYLETFDDENLKRQNKEVLFVGRLIEKHKKVSRILKAWQILQKRGVKGWKLTIVGEGPNKDLYINFVNEKSLKDVYFEGYQNPLSYYKRASIFCMTSAFEGLAMTIVEAQQNGCVPIVMDTFSSCHEIISDGCNGILIKDGDVEGFADAIQRLMIDDKKRLALKLGGLESCKKNDVKNIVDKWESVYKSLIHS